ncbi:hypothetical protein GF378_02690 [Candidatus Pacearchaeota archaeon]|nr:hypothetical protein [Candidatus Pacearchaeota archaeon]
MDVQITKKNDEYDVRGLDSELQPFGLYHDLNGSDKSFYLMTYNPLPESSDLGKIENIILEIEQQISETEPPEVAERITEKRKKLFRTWPEHYRLFIGKENKEMQEADISGTNIYDDGHQVYGFRLNGQFGEIYPPLLHVNDSERYGKVIFGQGFDRKTNKIIPVDFFESLVKNI